MPSALARVSPSLMITESLRPPAAQQGLRANVKGGEHQASRARLAVQAPAGGSELIDPASCFPTKCRLMFSRQVDAERKCMTGIAAPPKPVYPVIADAYAGRG